MTRIEYAVTKQVNYPMTIILEPDSEPDSKLGLI